MTDANSSICYSSKCLSPIGKMLHWSPDQRPLMRALNERLASGQFHAHQLSKHILKNLKSIYRIASHCALKAAHGSVRANPESDLTKFRCSECHFRYGNFRFEGDEEFFNPISDKITEASNSTRSDVKWYRNFFKNKLPVA